MQHVSASDRETYKLGRGSTVFLNSGDRVRENMRAKVNIIPLEQKASENVFQNITFAFQFYPD